MDLEYFKYTIRMVHNFRESTQALHSITLDCFKNAEATILQL